MKTYALYDKDGSIKKIISTTRRDIVEDNLKEGMNYIEVDQGVKKNTHQIVDGKVEVLKEPIKLIIPYSKYTPSKQVQPITEADIDAVKDIDGLKAILKQMIPTKALTNLK